MTLGNVMFIYGMTLGTYWKYHCQVQISTVDIVPIIVIFSCCRLVFIGICWKNPIQKPGYAAYPDVVESTMIKVVDGYM